VSVSCLLDLYGEYFLWDEMRWDFCNLCCISINIITGFNWSTFIQPRANFPKLHFRDNIILIIWHMRKKSYSSTNVISGQSVPDSLVFAP
jgi:hypothetical protein